MADRTEPPEEEASQPSPAEKLEEIARALRAGRAVGSTTPRELLRWFGVRRRSFWNVEMISAALEEAQLRTEPDFNTVWLDAGIEFELDEPTVRSDESPGSEVNSEEVRSDPTFRIGRLKSASNRPVYVSPNTPVQQAMTIMLLRDFSQLAVMSTERDVKGMISWASIGRHKALGRACQEVRECMDTAHILNADSSLFEAINDIVTYECVLIRDKSRAITGIVTTSDLSAQFRQLTEPFLLLSEIENHIRAIIQRARFDKHQLQNYIGPIDGGREIEGVTDLTFGEYLRLLENPDFWAQVRLPIDRVTFTSRLDQVRQIRNDVMHFDPDGVSEEDLATLRSLVKFFQAMDAILNG